MNKQQTAVEWLEFEITKRGPHENNPPQWLIELYEQAKEMEKERAIKFACDVHMNVKKDKVKSLMQLVDEKYNETYE